MYFATCNYVERKMRNTLINVKCDAPCSMLDNYIVKMTRNGVDLLKLHYIKMCTAHDSRYFCDILMGQARKTLYKSINAYTTLIHFRHSLMFDYRHTITQNLRKYIGYEDAAEFYPQTRLFIYFVQLLTWQIRTLKSRNKLVIIPD